MQYNPFEKLTDLYPFNDLAIEKLLPEFPMEDVCDEYLQHFYGDNHYALAVEADSLNAKLAQHNNIGNAPITERLDNVKVRIFFNVDIKYCSVREEQRGSAAIRYINRERISKISLGITVTVPTPSLLLRLVCHDLTYQQDIYMSRNFWTTKQFTACRSHSGLMSTLAGLGINNTATKFMEICNMQQKLMEAAYQLWPFAITPPIGSTRLEYIQLRFYYKLNYRIAKLINLLGYPNVKPERLKGSLPSLPEVKPVQLYDAFRPHERVQLMQMLDRLFLMQNVTDPPQKIDHYGAQYD